MGHVRPVVDRFSVGFVTARSALDRQLGVPLEFRGLWGRRTIAVSARPEPALYRNSARFFALFLVLTVWAFLPSYFARLFDQPNLWFHAHGIVLALWLAMLVVQAQLIRTRRRAWHRRLGKASFVLAPAVVLVTAVFVHHRVGGGVDA